MQCLHVTKPSEAIYNSYVASKGFFGWIVNNNPNQTTLSHSKALAFSNQIISPIWRACHRYSNKS